MRPTHRTLRLGKGYSSAMLVASRLMVASGRARLDNGSSLSSCRNRVRSVAEGRRPAACAKCTQPYNHFTTGLASTCGPPITRLAAAGAVRHSNPAVSRSARVAGPDSMLTKRRARSGSCALRAHCDRVDRRKFESRGQRPDQDDARRVPNLGDLRAADESRCRRAGELAHGRRAVRKGMEPRRDGVVNAELAQHLHEVDAGRGELRVGEIESRGGERASRATQGRRRSRAAVRPRERRRPCARGRAARRCRHCTCPAASSAAMSGAVRMIASHGAPAERACRASRRRRRTCPAPARRWQRESPLRLHRRCPARRRRKEVAACCPRAAATSLVGLRSGDLHDALPLDDVGVEIAAELVGRHRHRQRALARPLLADVRHGSGSS